MRTAHLVCFRMRKAGGYVFLGHSESVLGLTDELSFVHHNKGTAYRKVQRQ